MLCVTCLPLCFVFPITHPHGTHATYPWPLPTAWPVTLPAESNRPLTPAAAWVDTAPGQSQPAGSRGQGAGPAARSWSGVRTARRGSEVARRWGRRFESRGRGARSGGWFGGCEWLVRGFVECRCSRVYRRPFALSRRRREVFSEYVSVNNFYYQNVDIITLKIIPIKVVSAAEQRMTKCILQFFFLERGLASCNELDRLFGSFSAWRRLVWSER